MTPWREGYSLYLSIPNLAMVRLQFFQYYKRWALRDTKHRVKFLPRDVGQMKQSSGQDGEDIGHRKRPRACYSFVRLSMLRITSTHGNTFAFPTAAPALVSDIPSVTIYCHQHLIYWRGISCHDKCAFLNKQSERDCFRSNQSRDALPTQAPVWRHLVQKRKHNLVGEHLRSTKPSILSERLVVDSCSEQCNDMSRCLGELRSCSQQCCSALLLNY